MCLDKNLVPDHLTIKLNEEFNYLVALHRNIWADLHCQKIGHNYLFSIFAAVAVT